MHRKPIDRSSQSLGFETLEVRRLLAADPILNGQPLIISEFMADNSQALFTRTRSSSTDPFDGEADSPDWIEILNVAGAPVDLGGMHLTDDVDAPKKWQFPTGTTLDAGEHLVVFASGTDIKNRALDEHGYFHADFRLSSGGEYLALTGSDGTAIHEFSPAYPPQRTDVSYSLPVDVRSLLDSNAAIEYLVPQDDSLEPDWRQSGFTNPNLAGVSENATAPVGFDHGNGPAEPGELVGAELIDRSSVDFASGSLVVLESQPFNAAGRVAEWSFFSNTTRDVTPLVFRSAGDEFEIVGIGRTRTSDGSGVQTFEFDLQSGSDIVEPEEYFFGFKDGDNASDNAGVVDWGRSESDVIRRYNGPLSGSILVGQQLAGGRTFGRSFSAQVTTQARLTGPIHTNVGDAMANASSLYIRYPFDAESTDSLKQLTLDIRYDDGFVAYLNGTEVARRNVPDAVQFDSTANGNQPVKDANQREEINISQFIGELIPGDNVLAIHGFNDAADGADFLIDARLVGVAIPSASDFGLADDPTPGRTNGETFSGFVDAPSFSHSHGLHDEPFTLQVNTPGSPEATIYFTIDGSEPTPSNPNAKLYEQPLTIDTTTILRAASYQDGLLPSLAETRTYIIPSHVKTQETLQAAVIDNPVWGPQFEEALKALPTVSIVTGAPIMVEGEIPTSFELMFPDGSEGFQVDAGIEVFGGTAVSFPKRSLRLSFKNLYGPPSLEFDVFDDPNGVQQFNQLILRPGSHDTPFWNGSNGTGNYIRNRWANDRQLEMGQPAPRGRFVHVYLDGVYWGQYQLMERANAAFMASNFGGEPEDYDALNAGNAIDGDLVAWNALLDAIDDGYDAVKSYLDVENYADYLLLQFYGGNDWDWRPESNWMGARKREPGAGFKFFAWDSDLILRNGALANNVYYGGPGFLWTLNGGVRQYPEFRRLLAERAQEYFFDGGMFTDERLRSDMDAFVEQLSASIIPETARWGSGNLHARHLAGGDGMGQKHLCASGWPESRGHRHRTDATRWTISLVRQA